MRTARQLSVVCLVVLAVFLAACATGPQTSDETGSTVASKEERRAEKVKKLQERVEQEKSRLEKEAAEKKAADDETAATAPAPGSPGKITVIWETQSEEACYGYNVYRADAEALGAEEGRGGPGEIRYRVRGSFERVNKDTVPGGGTTHVPQSYRFVDQPLPVGKIYCYRIEQVDMNGSKRNIGPVTGGKVTKAADAKYLEEAKSAE